MVLLKNKLFVSIVVILVVIAGFAGSFWYFNDRFSSDKNNTDNQASPDALDEQVAVSDIKYPSVDETKSRYTNIDEQFTILVSQAQGKQYFQKYDEALVYYEAALELDIADVEQKTLIQYAVYLMAIESGDGSLKIRYEEILGSDTIATIKREAEEREYNR